jgi:curli biogenesis system outer membrane secretion channel CsgG
MRRAGLVLIVLMFGALVPPADASRAPTKRERAAIKRVALKKCNSGGAPAACRFHKARVSTKNARYAWADVTTEGFSAVLLERANTKTRRFKVVGTQGGGVGDCSYWRKRAPRAVLKDLKVYGVEAGSGATGICG